MEAIKTIANDGTPIVTFEQQRDLAQEMIRNKFDIGVRKTNPDGSVAKSLYHNKAVNEDWFFDNRFRVTDGKLQLVTAQTSEGYRAIEDQRKGRLFAKHISAYEFVRKDKKLVYTNRVLVSDEDFIAHFTNKLDKEAMKEILPLIPSGEPSVPEGKLPI